MQNSRQQPDIPAALALLGDKSLADEVLFNTVSRALSLATACRWTGVAVRRGHAIEIVALTIDGESGQTFSCSLDGSPCQQLYSGNPTTSHILVSSQLAGKFPSFTLLERFEAQSYRGEVFYDLQGLPAGHIFVMDDRPLERGREIEEFFHLLAQRVDAEYRRMAMQGKLTIYQKMLASTRDFLSVVDREYRYQAVGDYFIDYFGYRREDVVGHTLAEVHGQKNFDHTMKPLLQRCFNGELVSGEFWQQNGIKRLFMDVSLAPLIDEGEINSVLMSARDVTQRHIAEENRKIAESEMRRSEHRFRDFAEAAADFFWETDVNFHITYISDRCAPLLDLKPAEVIGRNLLTLLEEFAVDFSNLKSPTARMRQRQAFHHSDIIWNRRDGEISILQLGGTPVYDDHQEFAGFRGACCDITEAHNLTKQLTYHVRHDHLTGLINRAEFELHLHRAMQLQDSRKVLCTLCYIDLDQFKVINDTLGHVAGDELIRQLARHLLGKIKVKDTVGRLGGDEFGILFEDCALSLAKERAQQLLLLIHQFRFQWEDREIQISASIGLVNLGDCGNYSELMGAADTACFAAKDAGRNRLHVYHPNDANLLQRHGEMQWVSRIREALARDQFRLFVQPIVPVKHNTANHHYELLIRMITDRGEVVLPSDFLPAAERYQLAVDVDRWVIRKVFSELAVATQKLPEGSLIMINLSGQSLADHEFNEFFLDALDRAPFSPTCLCFEVTESATISNLSYASRFIREARRRGCLFALDDFGAGWSSYAYLKNLAVDFLKIDGSFIKDMLKQPVAHAIVHSMNELGHAIGYSVVAESVENESTLTMLREMGVDYAQGKVLGAPRPLASIWQVAVPVSAAH